MKEFKFIYIGMCIAAAFIIGFNMGKNEAIPNKSEPTFVMGNNPSETTSYKAVFNSMNSDKHKKIIPNKPAYNYSDAEIRILREKQSFKSDGGYIYTPGRVVPSSDSN